MRTSDRLRATAMHASARFTVHHGDELRLAGDDVPVRRTTVGTRHGTIPVHVYEPAGPSASEGGRGAHVHFHGGAWLMRHPQMDDWWCRYVAATAGVTVYDVDFRTGPYVAFPVSQEQ